MTMERYKPLFKENFSYDLKKNYDHFNKIFFKNELPDIHPQWNSSLRVTGGQSFPLKKEKNIIGLEKIEISSNLNKFIKEEILNDVYDIILIHEMIHGWIYIKYGKVKMDHGKEFKDKMEEINSIKPLKFLDTHKFTQMIIPNEYWLATNKNKLNTNLIG